MSININNSPNFMDNTTSKYTHRYYFRARTYIVESSGQVPNWFHRKMLYLWFGIIVEVIK